MSDQMAVLLSFVVLAATFKSPWMALAHALSARFGAGSEERNIASVRGDGA